MTDKILALLSISLLVGFMGVVAVFVNEPDLWFVVILVLALAIYDFWTTFWRDGSSAIETQPPP